MIPEKHWQSILRGAATRSLQVEITRLDAWNLFLEQHGRCALTGFPLILKPNKSEERTASLDRINSDLGYVGGNVQWVHKHVNQLKSDWPQEKFLAMIQAIYLHSVAEKS